ncbi:MAG: hypothetical protein ACI8QZ_002642 [Chlamydiales bacterium]|jgi:hypothetical protein
MRTQIGWICGLFVVAFGGGCSPAADTGVIDDVRERRGDDSGSAIEMATADRFGMRPAAAHGPGDGHDHGGASDTAATEFGWTVPEGWQELAPTSMRRANFRVAGSPDAECYLTFLPGGAGGVEANINRWRGQMSLSAMDTAEIEQLPLRSLVGGEAVLIDMVGDYSGMGSDAQADYRMVGLILEAPSATLFLKMVGPAAVIDGEIDHFHELAGSFAMREPSAPAAPQDGPNSAQGLSWETPEGWVRGGERQMRLVTLMPESAPDVECYVTFLPGQAGGVHANINRWRGQMGQSELTLEDIDALPVYQVLGSEAVFIEIEGDFVGMSGNETSDAGFLGLIGSAGTGTLFVKMTGSGDVIRAEKQHFIDFCESLSVDQGH